MTVDAHFLTLFRRVFEAKLQEKTNWGRNDLMRVFTEAQLEAVLQYLQSGGQ